MTLALPRWAQKTYRTISNMHVLPTGCLPNTPYLCFRSVVRDNGETENRCKMMVDFWGPDDRWHSPQLGNGIYLGVAAIPGAGPWRLSRNYQPPADELCLVFCPSAAHTVFNAVERGFYIGFRDAEGIWRLKLDSLARKKGFPEARRSAQILDDGNLLWLPLQG